MGSGARCFSSCHQERNPHPRAAPGLCSLPHNPETPLCPLLCEDDCPDEGAEECKAFWKTLEDRGKAAPSPLQPVMGRETAQAGLLRLGSRPRLCDSFELRSLL